MKPRSNCSSRLLVPSLSSRERTATHQRPIDIKVAR
jgi:hypothetical protein